MNRRKIISALTIAFMLTSNIPAFADPLSQQLQIQQEQLQQDRDTYGDLESKLASTSSSVQKMDNQIQSLMEDIQTTKDDITRTQQEIKNSEAEIQKAAEDLKNEQILFNKRVKAIYISGTESYLSILLNSKSIGDFLGRIENISKIINYDNNVMADLKTKSDDINRKKESLELENAKLASLQQDNQNKLSELNSKKDEQVRLVEDLKSQQRVYASRVSESQELVNTTLKQIEEIRKRNSQVVASKSGTSSSKITTSSRGSINASGEAIVAYASNFLGVPYVWGGNTPNGFDCSGFTKYVFNHFGISLNRRASEQALQGTPVSRDQLQPGDLVFFGNPVYHVGIYVGNNCFIHAPETGDVVKVSSLKWMDFSGARRMRY